MDKITCGPENAAEFNARLRETCPEFHKLAGQLFKAGLIEGLRGAVLVTGTAEEMVAEADRLAQLGQVPPPRAETCDGCEHWRQDTQGGGEGVGRCAVGAQPAKLKWPKQTACGQYREKKL